jgi:sugar phosphate permease
LLITGASLATAGFIWLSMFKVASSFALAVLPPSIVCAFAMGLMFSPLAMAATSGVDRADAGLASGVLNTARQAGGSLSLAILGTVAADRTTSLLSHVGARVAYVSGYQRAFEISAVIALLALIVSFTLPRHAGRATSE